MATQCNRRATWANSLPEIIRALWSLLEERGQSTGGYAGGDEEWATHLAKSADLPGLGISEEGSYECGPYRLMVTALSTEEGPNIDEPLLKLEIRPGVLWLNEVKRLTEEFKEAEPVAAK